MSKNTTGLAAWKKVKDATEEIKLPSGVVVEVKRLNLLEQVTCGTIPLEIFNASMAASGKMSSGKANMTQKEISNMMEMIDSITVLSVINPVVTKEEVGDIPVDDKMAVFSYNTTGVGGTDFVPFREE